MEALNEKLAHLKKNLEDIEKENERKAIELEISKIIKKTEKEIIKAKKMEEAMKEKKNFSRAENKQFISYMRGLPVRHIYKKKNDIWTGVCDGTYFLRNDNYYETPSSFGKAHLTQVATDTRINYNCDGWTECEVYYLQEWIKMDEFRRRVILV